MHRIVSYIEQKTLKCSLHRVNGQIVLLLEQNAKLFFCRNKIMNCSLVGTTHAVGFAKDGDFIVDNRYIFEVGGKGKGFARIRNIPDSFVAADDIEFGLGNKIPMWLFGFLY